MRFVWVALAALGVILLFLLVSLTFFARKGPLTPRDVEAVLAKEPATPEELFTALKRRWWCDTVYMGTDMTSYVITNRNNATAMWGNYFNEYPERIAEVVWYKKANSMPGAKLTGCAIRYMCQVYANSAKEWYLTDRPPTLYLILLSSESEIIGWVRWH